MDARLKDDAAGSLAGNASRQNWGAHYAAVRGASLDLAKGLTPEDMLVQSMPDASPTKWHLAHTTWFFETFLLKSHLADYAPIDPRYGYLFNSYYEAVGERHPRAHRGLLTRPSSAEVIAYRAHVDAEMQRLIDGAGAALWQEIEPLIELGFHHEQQHQELILMDIKHAFSCNPLFPAYRDRVPAVMRATPLSWVDVAGGLVEIGHDGGGFAFDNEGPRHKNWIEPFRLADRLVTAGEYLAFIEDGGYARADLWLSDGWATVKAEGWRAPLYWYEAAGVWSVFTLEGLRPLDPGAPALHLSFYEAEAFARWSGARLPTEQEWEHAVTSQSAQLRQLADDAWQWTASAYLPYPGYRAAKGAVGEYNGKFMSGQMVLRGASSATPASHARISYRNFFPPHARWAFSGVRLASDA